jgi:hypothetical protein
LWFGLSPRKITTIEGLVHADFVLQQEIGEATRVHRRNEIIDKPWCRWMWFGLSTSRNGAIGEVA